jgi:hypothetical protein
MMGEEISGCTESTGASSSTGQYFTGRLAMQRTLDAFMKFYNEQRPHQGYRLRGRPPISSGERRRSQRAEVMTHSGTAMVSTPLRTWTV